MQNILRITHLRMKWYNEKVGALNSKRTDDKLLLLMIKGIPGWSPNQFLTVTYVPHRLSRGFARYVLLVKLNILRNFERGFQKILEHSYNFNYEKPFCLVNKARGIQSRLRKTSSKGISKRTKSYLGCPLCSFFCSSQHLSFTRLFKVETPVNRMFFWRFWAISLQYYKQHINSFELL